LNLRDIKIGKKLNIADIVIIIIVIVIIAAGVNFLGGRSTSPGDSQVIKFGIEGKEVLEDAAYAPKVGDKIFNSDTSAYVGVITSVSVEPFTEAVFNPQRSMYELVVVPERYNVVIYAEGNGYHNEENCVVEGETLKVGQLYNIKGKGFAFEGYIILVEV